MSAAMQQKQKWLPAVTYDCSDEGFSDSIELVFNKTYEKVNEK